MQIYKNIFSYTVPLLPHIPCLNSGFPLPRLLQIRRQRRLGERAVRRERHQDVRPQIALARHLHIARKRAGPPLAVEFPVLLQRGPRDIAQHLAVRPDDHLRVRIVLILRLRLHEPVHRPHVRQRAVVAHPRDLRVHRVHVRAHAPAAPLVILQRRQIPPRQRPLPPRGERIHRRRQRPRRPRRPGLRHLRLLSPRRRLQRPRRRTHPRLRPLRRLRLRPRRRLRRLRPPAHPRLRLPPLPLPLRPVVEDQVQRKNDDSYVDDVEHTLEYFVPLNYENFLTFATGPSTSTTTPRPPTAMTTGNGTARTTSATPGTTKTRTPTSPAALRVHSGAVLHPAAHQNHFRGAGKPYSHPAPRFPLRPVAEVRQSAKVMTDMQMMQNGAAASCGLYDFTSPLHQSPKKLNKFQT